MQELRVVPPVLAPPSREHPDGAGDHVLKAAFDASSDAIVAVDAHMRLVSLNPAASALFGAHGAMSRGLACHEVLGCTEAAEEGELRQASLHAVVGHRPRACPRCPFREAMARRTRITRGLVVSDEHGRTMSLRGSFVPVPGPRGGAVAVLRPAQTDGEHETPPAQDSDVERSLAHQVRSTLALISGYSQTLLHLSLDDTTRDRYLRQMTVAADWLAEIAEEILARPAPEPTAGHPSGPHLPETEPIAE